MLAKLLTCQWIIILMASTMVLILRLIDFIREALNRDFHMTRVGLDIFGTNALLIQLCIILASILFIRKSSEKLSLLRLKHVTK